MTEPVGSPISPWRYGMHPQATGMRIHSMSRVNLQLGEALRMEMTSADPGDEDMVHLQYYVATDLGPWALWLSCPRAEVDNAEASLRELKPSSDGVEQTQQPQDLFPFLHAPKRK
jgi:hypothetical protein